MSGGMDHLPSGKDGQFGTVFFRRQRPQTILKIDRTAREERREQSHEAAAGCNIRFGIFLLSSEVNMFKRMRIDRDFPMIGQITRSAYVVKMAMCENNCVGSALEILFRPGAND